MAFSATPTYLATVLPGLESVAASELAVKLPGATVVESQRGRLLFKWRGPALPLTVLRTFDNLYLAAALLEIGPPRLHLADLTSTVARVDILGYARLAFGVAPKAGTSYFLNASRVGNQTFSRFELADAAMSGVSRACAGWQRGTPAEHDVELRLDLVESSGLLSIRLTDPRFRYRVADRGFAPAALRPSVAHGLVWAAGTLSDEVFLDPFCGSGTIMTERAAYRARAILGGDSNPSVLVAAETNTRGLPLVRLACWDARQLPLDTSSIDTIVTNLPFGRQIADALGISALYTDSLREMRRVLRPTGRAYLLTDQRVAVGCAMASVGFRAAPILQLSLKGLHPCLYEARIS